MVKQVGQADGSRGAGLEAWTARLNAALEAARKALAEGDAGAAERAGKAVSALVKALKDVEELEAFALGQRPEENDEELRATLERRIARFIGADRGEDLPQGPGSAGPEAPQP